MNFEIKKTKNGQGIVAKKEFQKSETLFEIKGKRVHYLMVEAKGGKFQNNAFRVSRDYYLSPKGKLGDFLNHSCVPNSFIKKSGGKLFLLALKDIKKGEEILLDYSTILAKDDIWEMECNCRTRSCRKLIRSYKYLPKNVLKIYKHEKIVPDYIVKM